MVRQRILDGQNTPPGMPQQVEITAIQSERLPYLLHLIHKALDRPQRRVPRLVAVRTLQLVVVVILDLLPRKVAIEGLEVGMVGPRPSVQEQDFLAWVIPYALRPHLKLPRRRGNGDHAHPSRQHIVAPRRIEVVHGRVGLCRQPGQR